MALYTRVAFCALLAQLTLAQRAHNFGPGPAALPEAVLQAAQAEFLSFEGSGYSVLEWTNIDSATGMHPGVAPGHKLQEMMLATEAKLRKAIDIPP